MSTTLDPHSGRSGEPVSVRRLRPNLMLEDGKAAGPFPEDHWVGHTPRVGTTILSISGRCERCVMVNHARGDFQARPTLLKTIGRVNQACAGLYGLGREFVRQTGLG